uniref:Uncharacterized protein n=1 Tax=Anopheles coluzzii TaxID=1518534 RepID=A0A8W7PYG3_ANOCL
MKGQTPPYTRPVPVWLCAGKNSGVRERISQTRDCLGRVASFASTVHAKRALLYNCSSFFKFVAIALGLGPALAVTVGSDSTGGIYLVINLLLKAKESQKLSLVGLAGLRASAYTESPHQFVVAEFIVPVSRDEFQLPSFRFHTGPLRGGR